MRTTGRRAEYPCPPMTLAKLLHAHRTGQTLAPGSLPDADIRIRSAEGYVGRFPGLEVVRDPQLDVTALPAERSRNGTAPRG